MKSPSFLDMLNEMFGQSPESDSERVQRQADKRSKATRIIDLIEGENLIRLFEEVNYPYRLEGNTITLIMPDATTRVELYWRYDFSRSQEGLVCEWIRQHYIASGGEFAHCTYQHHELPADGETYEPGVEFDVYHLHTPDGKACMTTHALPHEKLIAHMKLVIVSRDASHYRQLQDEMEKFQANQHSPEQA